MKRRTRNSKTGANILEKGVFLVVLQRKLQHNGVVSMRQRSQGPFSRHVPRLFDAHWVECPVINHMVCGRVVPGPNQVMFCGAEITQVPSHQSEAPMSGQVTQSPVIETAMSRPMAGQFWVWYFRVHLVCQCAFLMVA